MNDAQLTADTVTDKQIRDILTVAERECRIPFVRYISIDAPECVANLIAANWALGNFEDWYLDDTGYFHRVGGKHADQVKCRRNGRIRCAAIANARRAQEST